jgi:hypothetical protein
LTTVVGDTDRVLVLVAVAVLVREPVGHEVELGEAPREELTVTVAEAVFVVVCEEDTLTELETLGQAE